MIMEFKKLTRRIIEIENKITKNTPTKPILLEAQSKGCSDKQRQFYRRLFNTNQEIKRRFFKTIMMVFKNNFSNYWKEGKDIPPGIYDYEQPGRSVLNKINTNYSCFCVLVNDINDYLRKYGMNAINFHDKSEREQINEVEKLNRHIINLKDRIFNPKSSTFKVLASIVDTTNKLGDEREINAVINLKKIFNTNNVYKVGELGGIDDMLGGIDAYVDIDDKKKTIQIKPFTKREQKGNNVIMYGTGNVKPYNTDYMVFHNDKIGTLVFDNSDTRIVNGRFVFHIDKQINDL